MVEAAIPIGPLDLGSAGFAPLGAARTPDCTSYNSRLAFTAIAGMSLKQASRAVESDVVSHIIELQRPVNFLDFSIKKAKVIDRFGKEVEKEVLWSDDFGKSIQKATNMEERGGQVWDLTDRLSDRVVNTSGESWHLVASPDIKREGDEHRLIVVHNPGDGSERVREYFVTIRSSQNALKRLVENISGQNFGEHQEDISSLIISREKNKEEAPVTLRDIFTQFTNALDDTERRTRHSFLEELKRDTHLSEKELETRNAEVGKLVKREIKEILNDKPTLSALGLVAQSIPGWAKMLEKAASYTANEPPLAPTATFRLIRKTPETGLERTPTQDIKLTRLDQQFAKQVIEPIVPILLALVGEIANWAEDDLIINVSTVRNDQLSPQVVVFQKQPAKDAVDYDDLYYLSESEKKASWQGIIAKILMFNREEVTSGQAKEVTYHQRSQQQGFDESGHPTYGSLQSLRFPWGVKSGNPLMMGILEDANWSMLDFLPIKIKEDEGSAEAIYNESRTTIIADFQKVLEYIADLDPEITSEVIDEKEAALEKEVVSLGRQMLGITFEGISFLLAVYDDENTCKEARQILAVLIYGEISQLGEDKNLLIQYPKLSSLKERLNKLSKSAAPLEKRFDRLKRAVSRLLILNRLNDYPINITSEYATNNILLMIFYLAGFIKLQKSAERLSNTGRMKQTAFMPRGTKSKKKLPLAGIIYSFSCQVIYQYRPLVIGRSDMTQYE